MLADTKTLRNQAQMAPAVAGTASSVFSAAMRTASGASITSWKRADHRPTQCLQWVESCHSARTKKPRESSLPGLRTE